MMRIALIGAPSSGKSALAADLREKLWNNESSLAIVDNFVTDVEEQSGWAAGPWASYLMNFMIASERMKREIGWMTKEVGFITCGTLIETATYMAMRGGAMTKHNGVGEINRDTHAMRTMGILLMDTFFYEHVFYLPLPAKNNSPALALIDEQIRASLETFEIPYATLGEEGRVAQAVEFIKQSEKDNVETTEAEQPAI